MFKYFLFISVLFISVLFGAATLAQNLDATDKAHSVFNYDVFAQDDVGDVGDMTVKIVKNLQDGYKILEHTSVKVEGLWGDKNVQSTAHENYSFEGDLVEADSKTFSKTRAYWTKISSYEEDLWINFSEIEDSRQQEASKLVNLSVAVLDNFVPQVGQIIGVSTLLFSNEKIEPVSIRLAKSSYHTTLAHLPIYWSTQQQKLPAQIKLLDKEMISVVSMDIEDKGIEIKTFKDVKISTRHYILTSKDTAPLSIWLALNENDTPYFFQLKGKDKDGLFTIKLKP